MSGDAVMSRLEREPEETIVDPCAVERATLAAIGRDAVVAGAGDDEIAFATAVGFRELTRVRLGWQRR